MVKRDAKGDDRTLDTLPETCGNQVSFAVTVMPASVSAAYTRSNLPVSGKHLAADPVRNSFSGYYQEGFQLPKLLMSNEVVHHLAH